MRGMCLKIVAAALVWAAGAQAGTPAFAQDYEAGLAGGPGGAPFNLRCASGDYLVGVQVRAGTWVDAIAPLCGRWDVTSQSFLAPGIGPWSGGPGGSFAQLPCDSASAVTSFRIEAAPTRLGNVATLEVRCVSVLTLRNTDWAAFGTTVADREAEAGGYGTTHRVEPSLAGDSDCREGDFAVGIYGAAGAYVDRIGVLCGPRPVRRSAGAIIQTPPVAGSATPAPSRPDASASTTGRITPERQRYVPTCRTGFVWREARENDYVCVTPESRTLVRQENANAASRVNPNGAYGPNTCIAGFVWREAFDGDVVCVTPERRANVQQENDLSYSRTVPPPIQP